MNPWAHHDRFSAINDAAMRQVGAEDLIVEIAAALSVAGEYVARLDLRRPSASSTSTGRHARRPGDWESRSTSPASS